MAGQCVLYAELILFYCKNLIEYIDTLNPSGRTLALGSTQPLTEMSKGLPATGPGGPRGSG